MSDDVERPRVFAVRLVDQYWHEGVDGVPEDIVPLIEARDRLVAKRERERCARVCDSHAFALYDTARQDGLRFCAAAIRALPDEEPST